MRISQVEINGFRGLATTIELDSPLALLVGANNAGKSATIDALRSLFLPFADGMGNRWITPTDFTRVDDATTSERIIIRATIVDVPEKQKGRLISLLAPTKGADIAILTLTSHMNESGRPTTRWYGGDLGQNEVEQIAREALRFVYLPALRDATADLRPGQSNRLASLVSAHAADGHEDRTKLVDVITQANQELEKIGSIAGAAKAIQDRLTGMTGHGPFAHKSALKFAEARFERIIGSLQALAGGTRPERLSENGLGYNNLLYIAVLLSVLQESEDIPLSLLLVEEPEAHLHPQLQALLQGYLEHLSDTRTQVIATTHSPQFASSADVERITVLRRVDDLSPPSAHHLRHASLTKREFAHLGRFLDATKSMMLFSSAVILVEGIAELLLVPVLLDREGVSLREQGVTVVSVDGLAFDPFVKLFNPAGLPIKCALISDSDPTSSTERSAKANLLLQLKSQTVSVFLARTTFEWDLAEANWQNPDLILEALRRVHPRLADAIARENFARSSDFANRFLSAVEDEKGRFAQELSHILIENPQETISTPPYLIGVGRFLQDSK
ncbi:ATP-dependent endonuclease [Kocuria rosea]|uniref:ATP-dependent nuclease n=1 Tax=Kocuria rosea TaxID=1275 RepID=UPI0018D20490|nr:AAA family ATPase [Kocuria polaris]